MDAHSNLYFFLRALRDHYLFLFGTGFLTVFAMLANMKYKKLSNPKLFWIGAGICMLFAIYGAWSDERTNVAVLIAEKAQLTSQLQAQREQIKDLTATIPLLQAKVPSQDSLKVRAVSTADRLEAFFRKRAKHQPICNQTSTMPAEQQRAVIEPCAKCTLETMGLYSRKFAPNVMEMVAEFKSKGIDVINIENCAPGGWCGIDISVQLRAFAERLDANDKVKR